jgi:DNA-directed DNA polymerase III PolC
VSKTWRNFATCHCHPQSLDSASTPEAFAEREVELGTGVITCTDHGTLQACRKIYDLGKANGLTPVLGLEAYLRDDNCPILTARGYAKNENGAFIKAPKYMHVTVHFMDQAAYECGVRLLSMADARLEETLQKLEAKDRKHGEERKPLFTWTDLEELGGHNVTMTTGCMIGLVQRHILENDDLQTATAYFDKLQSIVKPGNLYTELFPHDTGKNWVDGIFIYGADGSEVKVYDKKVLRTNVGEIRAGELAKVWTRGEHNTLVSVKDRTTWREMAPLAIKEVKHVSDYVPNECRPWAPNGDLQAGLNRAMRYLAKQRNVKLLIGDDSHFAKPDEKIVQDVRMAQKPGKWRFYGSYHRQSSEEAFEHFQRTLRTSETEFEGWIDNSHEWASRFKNFEFNTPVSLPTKFYEVKYAERPWFVEGSQDNSLRYTLELVRKHGRMQWGNRMYTDRLKAEINLLHNNGVIDLLPYFMIDEEICSFFEERGLLTGPGRGSAAGLLLTYCLSITHVDPLKYELSMDRFLTVDRIKGGKLPDIDQDLPKMRRDLLIDPQNGFLKQRFGDHVAQISVDSTLKLKMAVKDVSRQQRGFVHPDIELLTKKFIMPPQGVEDYDFVMGYDNDEGHVQGSVEYDPALQDYIIKFPDDWKIVQKCLGLARQKGRHACAFVIANRPIHEFIPLTTVSQVRVTAYTAPSVEAVGGLKMDFLGLGALDDISDAIKLIQARSGRPLDLFKETVINGRRVPGHRLIPVPTGNVVDIWDLPNDQGVFSDVALGKTETVFQFNTPGAVQWLEHFAYQNEDGNFAIDSVEDMAAFTALDRPGPLDIHVTNPEDGSKHNMLVEYARRARGAAPSPDVLPIFDQLIPETYGVMVYQEQLQRVYQQLTGCSGADAEEFRANVAKKKKAKIEKAYLPFVTSAGAKIGKENAEAAWAFFITWAKYGFNKSHAVCYAVIGYACAFVKRHYPLEWWTSVLSNAAKNEVNEKFWRHCGHLIDLPDVKVSGGTFEIQNDRIRAPLNLLKGVGDGAHAQLSKYAPYTDIKDFCLKIEEHRIATGVTVMKKKKYKDKENKVFDPEKGKMVSSDAVKEVPVFSKGHNALNRGVIKTLITSGAMDSLFPDGTYLVDQMMLFEQAMAAAETETNRRLNPDAKKPKIVKAQPVDVEALQVGPLKRYQMRKATLPIFGMDLIPLAVRLELINAHPVDGPYVGWVPPNGNRQITLPVATADDVTKLEVRGLEDDRPVQVAVVAYVDEVEVRNYGDEQREMCKLRLDIEGARFEYVKWAGKAIILPNVFKTKLKGAVVLAVLNKYKSDRPFSVEDLFVLERPLNHEDEPEKSDDTEKEATDGKETE